MTPEQTSSFFLFSGVFWYLKPIAGILSDAFPLFGTRRRHYLLFSSALAAVSWIVLGFVHQTFISMMVATIILNLFLVMMSTVAGAFVVEIGQSRGEVGKLTGIRVVTMNVCGVIQGPLGGMLATMPFLVATGVNAGLVFIIFPVAFFFFKENRLPIEDRHPLANAKRQVSVVARSGTFWMALLFIALVNFAPGFTTLQYYRQNDVLHLSQQTIGWLNSVNGLGGVLAALAYIFLAKRSSMRALLACAVATCAAGTLPYLFYNSLSAAWAIDFQYGLFYGFLTVALMDLAARASPAGCEGLAFSLMMSIYNLSASGADTLGAHWSDAYHWPWKTMVFINAATTAVVLVMLPFMPRPIMLSRDDQIPNLENTGEPKFAAA